MREMPIVWVLVVVVSMVFPAMAAEPKPNCRTSFKNTTGGFKGAASWDSNGAWSFTGMTEARTRGELLLTCTYTLAGTKDSIYLDLGGARVSFASAPSKESGSGLVVSVNTAGESLCEVRALRTAGEDWSELGKTVYRVPVSSGTSKVALTFRLIDVSDRDALRVDLSPFTISNAPTGVSRECPPR